MKSRRELRFEHYTAGHIKTQLNDMPNTFCIDCFKIVKYIDGQPYVRCESCMQKHRDSIRAKNE